jgi:uncharacterized protein (TIGR03435 family)
MTLRLYLCRAFAIDDCQAQISGPGWIDTEMYDVVANIPPDATDEQFQIMLQELLRERFSIVLHHEKRMLSVYELTVAKGGPRLKESDIDGPPVVGPPTKVEHDSDGFPVLQPGSPAFIRSYRGRTAHWAAQGQTMATLARSLGEPLATGRQVIDKTGLKGKYDFRLFYERALSGAPPGDGPEAPILEDALRQQLGLTLVNAKAQYDFMIIDSGNKTPIEN